MKGVFILDNNINDDFNMDCSDIMTIPIILNSIREINRCRSKIYYYGRIIDYNFIINGDLSLGELELLEKSTNSKLPHDYKEFLMTSNGLTMSSGARLLDINEIYYLRELYDYPRNILIIGECYSSELQIAIDLNGSSENCMYVIDVVADDYFYSINCDFTTFLNRFILSYGSDFWEWSKTISNILKIPRKVRFNSAQHAKQVTNISVVADLPKS